MKYTKLAVIFAHISVVLFVVKIFQNEHICDEIYLSCDTTNTHMFSCVSSNISYSLLIVQYNAVVLNYH